MENCALRQQAGETRAGSPAILQTHTKQRVLQTEQSVFLGWSHDDELQVRKRKSKMQFYEG